MSLVSGLFTLPVGRAFFTYQQARFRCPVKNQSTFNTEERRRIEVAMEPFLNKVGVRRDLTLIEIPNPGFCLALGTNMFKNSDAVVLLAPGFYKADKEACSWVMKHEISHIKYNDPFTMNCVPCVCQLAASIFGMCSLSFFPALGLSFTVGIVSHALFSQWREAKADDFAIKHSSEEELKGGRRFLMAFQEWNVEHCNTFWKRVAVLDIVHPSIISRIQKVEKALHARNIKIDIEAERINIERNRVFFADKMREIGC